MTRLRWDRLQQERKARQALLVNGQEIRSMRDARMRERAIDLTPRWEKLTGRWVVRGAQDRVYPGAVVRVKGKPITLGQIVMQDSRQGANYCLPQ
jgi:hypothetical protein